MREDHAKEKRTEGKISEVRIMEDEGGLEHRVEGHIRELAVGAKMNGEMGARSEYNPAFD